MPQYANDVCDLGNIIKKLEWCETQARGGASALGRSKANVGRRRQADRWRAVTAMARLALLLTLLRSSFALACTPECPKVGSTTVNGVEIEICDCRKTKSPPPIPDKDKDKPKKPPSA